ncbi:MAG TPA: hypothetical protein VN663_22780 [Ramlibacter sp.]|nr:hypothetical protein [Ramlibacter sp.]
MARDEMSRLLQRATQTAGGDPPEAVWWFCKDGSVRRMTMTEADPRCDDCDCGYGDLMDGPIAPT